MTKIALITGGNKGLGLAQSQLFLEDGYRVVVVGRTLGDFETLGSQFGDAARFCEADLATADADEVMARATGVFGAPDVLINNAGRHLKKPAWEVAPDEFDAVVNLNLKAMFGLSAAFIRLRKDVGGGAIVNISSMAGLIALPSAAAYVTTKTAVVGLTRSVAVDAAAFGMRCNAVCPGFIETDMTRAVLAKDPDRRRKIEGRIPTGKFGTAQDVAQACLFLAGERSAYINGVALPVDAGFSIGF
ncbi:SDR family NAD(P)-dependent oxidoreductase [Caulobacter sp. X]|uniref:SDR family NAD(P)-dependent oxidoreductase n=1 Tax=Caulobacter sp. X TaxID=2048901 RepID=UPI000C144CB4|nr:SDR family NAD(P)-dependent oxidoreductase [Caulobacter sp. X]PIB95244.1 3-oxoacyl-ACP reductase [Caulobacter sp. X]